MSFEPVSYDSIDDVPEGEVIAAEDEETFYIFEMGSEEDVWISAKSLDIATLPDHR